MTIDAYCNCLKLLSEGWARSDWDYQTIKAMCLVKWDVPSLTVTFNYN